LQVVFSQDNYEIGFQAIADRNVHLSQRQSEGILLGCQFVHRHEAHSDFAKSLERFLAIDLPGLPKGNLLGGVVRQGSCDITSVPQGHQGEVRFLGRPARIQRLSDILGASAAVEERNDANVELTLQQEAPLTLRE
jgi:hypothetical protein